MISIEPWASIIAKPAPSMEQLKRHAPDCFDIDQREWLHLSLRTLKIYCWNARPGTASSSCHTWARGARSRVLRRHRSRLTRSLTHSVPKFIIFTMLISVFSFTFNCWCEHSLCRARSEFHVAILFRSSKWNDKPEILYKWPKNCFAVRMEWVK